MRKTELVRGEIYRYTGHWVPNTIRRIANYTVLNVSEKDMRACNLKYIGTAYEVTGERWNEPAFEAFSPGVNGGVAFRFRLQNCAPIEPASEVVGQTRKERAEAVRLQVEGHKSEIQSMKLKISELEKTIAAGERQANMLEKYDTDEEALAATFAKIIQTGGSETEILEILQEFGMTNKL
jgi:hypothetical protein